MKLFVKLILTGVLLFSIFACAPSVTRNDATRLTVGILNEFPETPKYIKKRTFVFRHQVTAYDTDGFKKIITDSAEEYLISKGYKVIEVESRTALTDGRADMIVQILPLNIYKQDGTLGYGFYDRKFLEILIKQPARSYICLDMKLYRRGRGIIVQTRRQEGFSKLMIKELPESPDLLTENERKEMTLNLKSNIKQTISRAIPILGL